MSSSQQGQSTSPQNTGLVLWRLSGREFRSAQEIIRHIEALPQVNQEPTIEALRRDLTRLSVQNDQMMHDIYAWVLERDQRGELRQPDNYEAWRILREGYLRMRNRRREGRNNLAGKGKWCTETFWDEVVEPLTGASIDVANVLRQIREKEISPLEAIQRGCMEMFRRLSGGSKARTRQDMHCTAGDLREGNITRPSAERLSQAKLVTAGLSLILHLDEYGFLWHHPPAIPITNAVQQQRDHDATRAKEQVEKEQAARTPKPGPSDGGPGDVSTRSSLQSGPASNLRKRPEKAKVENVSPAPSPRGRASTPLLKRPKKSVPSPGARQASEMDKVFSQLNVIKTKTARQRSASLRQQGKQEEETLSPNRMPIPVKNSTNTQRAIWEVIEKRVKGIKFRQEVDISTEAAHAMELPPAQLVREIEAIASGLSETSASDDTLLVYTQCLLDAFRAQIVAQKAQTDEMAELRHVVATWHRRYRDRNVTLIPGNINEGGVQLDHYDIASLLLGDGYDGWLNGDLIHGILTITAHDQYVVPARAFDFWHQGNHPDDIFHVPGNHPSLIVPVHWGNHWALLIADRQSGQIFYLDSLEVAGRRQMAMASMRNFLNLHPGYNSIVWHENSRRSTQQVNTYDCGIWVVHNAWAWTDHTDLLPSVGVAERLQIGRAVLAAAETADQVRQPVPTDEMEYLGMRNLAITPTRAQQPSSRAVTPQSRMTTPRREQLVRTAIEAQRLRSSTTPEAPSSSSELSSVRSSQLRTPAHMRTREGLVDTSRRVTERGSPMPRESDNREQEPESARKRGTRSGKEF
jgi:hypothetical protein